MFPDSFSVGVTERCAVLVLFAIFFEQRTHDQTTWPLHLQSHARKNSPNFFVYLFIHSLTFFNFTFSEQTVGWITRYTNKIPRMTSSYV